MHPIGTILEENNNEAPSCGNTTKAKTGAEKKNQAKHPKTASNLDKILQHIAPEDKATPAAVDINVETENLKRRFEVAIMLWKTPILIYFKDIQVLTNWLETQRIVLERNKNDQLQTVKYVSTIVCEQQTAAIKSYQQISEGSTEYCSYQNVRRAKFLAKPLLNEINILLQENDVICREDLVQQQNVCLSPSSTNTIIGGTQNTQSFTMSGDRTLMNTLESDRSDSSEVDKLQSVSMTMWTPTSPTTKIRNISNRKNIFSSFAFLRNTSTQSIDNADGISHKEEPDYISSSISNIMPLAYVDRLDDSKRVNNLLISNDFGGETQHYSRSEVYISLTGVNSKNGLFTSFHPSYMLNVNCAHGTPSRMPLISSASTSNDSKVFRPFVCPSSPSIYGFNNATKTLHFHRSSTNVLPNSNEKFMIQDQQQFQREGQHQRTQKSIMVNSGVKCNGHAARRTSLSPSFCYADDARSRFNCDNSYNSGDEDDGKELHEFEFLQTNLRGASYFDFYNSPLKSLHFSGKGRIQHYQVPLIIVILILIFYVCLGTMVFALWENWSLIDGAYFCFVTLTTIGCSGLIPEKTIHGSELQLILCCAYLLLGLVLVAMSFNILETQLIWSCKRLASRMKWAQD
uniref:Potassium channel domain-containing protein n=1 Tax=Glossina palpalis gambiensis TaxID=67801 RepID=A0A1B0BHH9_9MUSC